jgi:hypothetical protein
MVPAAAQCTAAAGAHHNITGEGQLARRGRLYLPLDVSFFDDDRIIAAGDGPTLLYLAICLRCKQLAVDGLLSEAQISRLGRPKWKKELARLVELEAVLWDVERSFYVVAAWFSHNEAMSAIEERRAADRKRKAEEARKAAEAGKVP